MSKYGVKIKNFEAASIYDVNLGTRNKFDSTDAMLVNSLFLDFLMENGLSTRNGESTRDVICLAFDYGSPSYEDEIAKHKNKLKKLEDESKIAIENLLIDKAIANADKFCAISRDDLRTKYYTEGVPITYKTYNKQGELIKEEYIHYQMLYRTPGKAKKGTCMFIRDELYDKAHNFLYMGIQLTQKNAKIVEAGAYASLITSSIVGRVQIKPEQILIVNDVDTFITTKVSKVCTNENKECYVEDDDNYKLKSTLFDGQALIDSSIFPDILDNGERADGYILLRNHMTKCAAFNTNIELFMREHFGSEYDTATLTDMFGRKVNVKDIKLITTDNAIKWLKFGVDFDYWAEWVRKNDSMWGIVKTTHESKFGDVQRTSYQMINSLDINRMDEVIGYSKSYIEKLKSDNDEFLDYLKKNVNFSNDYDVLVALVEHNHDFIYSDYFRSRKKAIINGYVLNFKSGRCLQNADNLTIVGSPYAMLMRSVGLDATQDPTFENECDSIQCWCERFKDGEYLAEFRNPFNSRNNLGYLHNHYHPFFDKYFRLGNLCVAVNMNSTDFQARNNGSDQDSDSIFTTNNPAIVEHAKYCYTNYRTIENCIPKTPNNYDLSLESYAAIDNTLIKSQMAIGQTSNMAQLALTYTYNFEDRKYLDCAAILAVLAQAAIDNAKRTSDVTFKSEIDRLSEVMEVETNGLPLFWQITKKDKRKANSEEQRRERKQANKKKIKEKLNEKLVCPMNYLYQLDFQKFRNPETTIPISEFFINYSADADRRKSKQIEELVEKLSFELYKARSDYTENGINWDEDETDLLLRSDFEEIVQEIRKVKISKNYRGLMAWLINRAFCIGAGVKSKKDIMDSKTEMNKAILLKVLYESNNKLFLECFKTQDIVYND